MKEKKNKKRKIRFKGLLVVLLIIYLLVTIIFYIWKMPIKQIDISGNVYLKDNYLINYIDIEKESIINVSKKNIKSKLLEIDLISDVKVRKNYFGKLYIEILEDKVLFYNWNNKMVVLSSGKEIDYKEEYLGIPTLINYVPDNIYKEFINKLNEVEYNVLSLVSEIEYSPSYINDKMVDETRFLFRMNDGNKVYINTINIEKFNDYLTYYEGIVNKNGNVKGCLYLDSNSENINFNNCKTIEKVDDEDGEN